MAEQTVLGTSALASSPSLSTGPGGMPTPLVGDSPAMSSAASVPMVVPVPAFKERRASRRFTCEGEAEVIVLGGALRFQGKVRDLSATGCCMTTNVVFTLERGTQVEVVMTVNRVQFRVMGGVRSNHKVRGVGLEFMNVSARCARFIKDLIAELEAKQGDESKAGEGVSASIA